MAGDQDDGRRKADEGPGVIVIAEQRRAIAGIARHDVQQDLAHGEGRAGGGDEQRRRVVAGARPEADIENGAHGQQRELDALEQAQGQGSSSSRSCAAKAAASTSATA